jgi:hypothetical protein
MGHFHPLRAMVVAGVLGVMASLAIPPALAEEAEGIVESVDLDRRLLTLVDGEAFILAEAVAAEEIETDENVFIVFELDDRGRKIALEVLLSVQD